MLNRSVFKCIGPAVVRILWLLPALSITQSVQATVPESSPRDGGATALAGMWCNQDAGHGETVVQYSVAGLEVTAFVVLSEDDPRRIGRQSSMRLTIEAPNVFLRRDLAGPDEVFSVHRDGLTVDSFWAPDRGARKEERQALTTQSYHRCDVREALQRAQAFLSSPRAEAATRKALQREAERKADIEQWEREDAEAQQRRNATREAYYADLIQQLSQVRGNVSPAPPALSARRH
jgi:hypothetical protein